MAQATLFMEAAELSKRRERQELVARGMVLWEVSAENYRTMLIRYLFLISEKRRLNVLPLRKIPRKILADYPEIPLFRYWNSDDVRAHLEDLTYVGLRSEVNWIEEVVQHDYAYNTLLSWVAEAEYLINHRCSKSSSYAELNGKIPMKAARQRVLNRQYHFTNYWY